MPKPELQPAIKRAISMENMRGRMKRNAMRRSKLLQQKLSAKAEK